MSTKSFSLIGAIFMAFLACTIAASGQGPATGNNTTSELAMSATVQTTVQLKISSAVGGASVTGNHATGLYSVDLGNIDAYGLGTPATGVTKVADEGGTLYTTPITLTPIFSGFTSETATIGVEQDPAGDTGMVREGSTDEIAGSTVSTSGPVTIASGVESGTPVRRYVGMYASRTEPAGAKAATLIYSVTVELPE
jgi:hypothetical protein